MEQNHTQEIKIYSKRAHELLTSPLYLLHKNLDLKVNSNWTWQFSVEKSKLNNFESDKILTLGYFINSVSSIESLFLEAISQMTLGRNIGTIRSLSFRELENFLRDENHLPVFEKSAEISPEVSFKKVKTSLLVTLLLSEIKKNMGNDSSFEIWSELNLIEKNKMGQIFISSINNLFSSAIPLQLALASTEEIAVVLNDFPISIEVIEGLANEILGKAEEISCLKVVAVQ